MSTLFSLAGVRGATIGAAALTILGLAAAPAASAAQTSAPTARCAPIVLKDVVASADHDGIGVSFNYSAPATDKDVAYLPAGEKPRQDGSGDEIKVKGKSFIRVVVHCYDWTNDTYAGPTRIAGEGAVKEIVHGGTFEGDQTWFIGVDRKRAYDDRSQGKSVSLNFKR